MYREWDTVEGPLQQGVFFPKDADSGLVALTKTPLNWLLKNASSRYYHIWCIFEVSTDAGEYK